MTDTSRPAPPSEAVFHGPAGEFVLRTDPASARWVFGDSIGDPTADEIWSPARERHEGSTRTEVSNLFSRNKKAREIDRALQALIDAGRLERTTIRDPGSCRTLTVWRPASEPSANGA